MNRIDMEAHETEDGKCFFCDRTGGVPFLMTGDGELHCSRCFKDFTPEEFVAWLQDSPLIAECGSCGNAETAQTPCLGVKQPVCCEGLTAVA
jgi:hypothetical protein